MIPDLDFFPIPDPGTTGQKGTGSRIRNTEAMLIFSRKNTIGKATVKQI
jgi:hypothetical protein